VAPVLDPATRTAQIEVEILNPKNRLKPGMYARVNLTTEQRDNALVVPANAIVDREGQRGVFLAQNNTAAFRAVQIGIEDPTRVEILEGVTEADQVVTTGAAALQDGDRIVRAGAAGAGGGPGAPSRGGRQAQGMRGQNQRPGGSQPQSR
jgi:RND family efflux transporter MFP subunit